MLENTEGAIKKRTIQKTWSKCIKFYKMYDEQKENIKHQKNSPDMWV